MAGPKKPKAITSYFIQDKSDKAQEDWPITRSASGASDKREKEYYELLWGVGI